MSVNNMKELLAYSAAQKTKRAEEWNQERLQHGYCRGLNHREYMRMRVSGKSVFRKGKDFSHQQRWTYTN
jgi:hypothetical protein